MATSEQLDKSPKIYHAFQNDRMNYTAFSRCVPYRREVLELMVEAVPYLRKRFIQVDIGAGNGLGAQVSKGITEVFLRWAIVLGIDPDPYAIAQASKDTSSSRRCKVQFIEGFGQDVEALLAGRIPPEGVDMVTILDSIHEFPPEDQFPIMQAGVRVLRPEGIFVMNSTFTSIAMIDNAYEWAVPVGRSVAKFKGSKRDEQGLLYRDPEEYTQMLRKAGLSLVYYQLSDVTLPTQALVDISKYPGFVEGIKRSYSFDQEPSLEELSAELQLRYGKSKSLNRKWSRWISQKSN